MKDCTYVIDKTAQEPHGFLTAAGIAVMAAFAAVLTFSGPLQAQTSSTTLDLYNKISAWPGNPFLFPSGSPLGSVIANAPAGLPNPAAADVYGFKNTLTVNNNVGANSVAGGASVSGTAADNILKITAAAGGGLYAIGGVAADASAPAGFGDVTVSGNSVYVEGTIIASTFSSGIIGGLGRHDTSRSAVLTGNIVEFAATASLAGPVAEIYGATLAAAPAGDGSGRVTGNGVIFNNGSAAAGLGWIVGGQADGHAAKRSVLTGNYVRILGAAGALNVAQSVYGAFLKAGGGKDGASVIQGNRVEMERGAVTGDVIGGYAENVAGALIEGNEVILSGTAAITRDVHGGGVKWSDGSLTANAVTLNNVKMSAGTVAGRVIGGHVTAGKADFNTVMLTGGRAAAVAGGYSSAGTAEVSDNEASLRSADGAVSVSAVYGGHVAGAGSVSRNKVKLEAGQHALNVSGEVIGGKSASAGDAVSNIVSLKGLSGASSITGPVTGGHAAGGKAVSNVVELENVSISGFNITGGFGSGGATGNNVLIRDSAVGSDVFGGNSSSGPATGNKVTLSGTVTFSAGHALRGGVSATDGFTGNTLVLDHVAAPVSGNFGAISGFESFVILVSDTAAKAAAAPSGALIKAASADLNGPGGAVSGFEIGIDGQGYLSPGDVVHIVDSAAPIAPAPGVKARATQGLLVYDLALDNAVPSQLKGTVASVSADAQARSFSEAPMASASFVNGGADLLASRAIPAAIAAASGEPGVSAFAALGYGRYRAETGSHVDVEGLSGDVGAAFVTRTSVGPFTAGAFFEFGDGSYESYNGFGGITGVRGEGDVSYVGGGILARLEIGRPESSRPYLEASARLGKTDYDFLTRDILAYAGQAVKFALDGKYRGFHAGGGYIVALKPLGFDANLDFSARYLYMRRDGDDFTVMGHRASVSAVTSSRLKAGARLDFGITPSIRPYFALFFEREFGGGSQVTYVNVKLPETTLKGSTGIGDLGLIVSSPGSPLEFQAGLQGSVGRREGISGSMSLRYTF
ncbi:MAG: hypothetical protein LBW85_00425 [Deltaproteobacteria bacterium]|nr:hypothetical protein [Deltaproteobacteria bacterium]